jgi:hypothetical protein
MPREESPDALENFNKRLDRDIWDNVWLTVEERDDYENASQ